MNITRQSFLTFILFLTILSSSCSEDEAVEDKLLFSYSSQDDSNAQIILLDKGGNLIDNQKVENKKAELNGPSDLDRYTIIHLDTTILGRPSFHIYVNTNQSLWEMPSVLRPTQGTSLDINIDSELLSEQLIISGEHRHIYSNGSVSNDITASVEDMLVVLWHGSHQIPKFSTYKNLTQEFMEVNIKSIDFSEMSFQTIESIPSEAYLYWHQGRTNTSQQNYYDLMGQSTIDVSNGYYYPSGLFDFWYTGFGFRDDNPNESYYTDYYGERPSIVTKMDIGEITLETSLAQYTAKSSNESVDIVFSRYRNVNVDLRIYSKNGDTIEAENIFNSLIDIYPDLELGSFNREYTWFYEIDGWDYDEFVNSKMSLPSLSNEIKSWKYYSIK